MGTVPVSLQEQGVEALKDVLISGEMEWIVAATAMFGAFNKFMDGLAIPLESDIYAETKSHMDGDFVPSKPASIGLNSNDIKDTLLPVPPVNDWTLKMAVIRQGIRPGGRIQLDNTLGKGVPTKGQDCVTYLEELSGGNIPVLAKLEHDRFRRALTAILAKNLVTDGISLSTKVLKATEALSYNPSRMTASLIDEIEASSLTAKNMVELAFLAVMQELHRIEVYY